MGPETQQRRRKRNEGAAWARRSGGLAALAGPALLAATSLAAWWGVEVVRHWYYQAAWYATLLAAAGAYARTTGRWPLSRGASLSLLLWSVPFWYLFELLNLRLANWYYVLVPAARLPRWLGTAVAFATVLPALHLAHRWVARTGLAEGWRRPPFRVRGRHRAAAAGLGATFLVLALWRPRAFYPLVWGSLTLLLEPFNHLRDPGSSLLGDLSRGRYARIVRLLAAGLAVGLLWESFNALAATRWIYTVPGLEEGKLFEMPLPGFLGFPVLALDAFVTYRALVHLGLAVPAWDEEDHPRNGEWAAHAGLPSGRETDGPVGDSTEVSRRRDPPGVREPAFRPGRTALLVPLALAFCLVVQAGVDRWTVDSYRLPGREAVGLVGGGEARRTGPEVPPEEVPDGMRALAGLRGIGLRNAEGLWRAGIRSACDLAAAPVPRIAAAVRSVRDDPRAGYPPRVRVWRRAARERCDARAEESAGGEAGREPGEGPGRFAARTRGRCTRRGREREAVRKDGRSRGMEGAWER